jgi:hypothetical protein
MKWNITLVSIAITYILINILFYTHARTMEGGSSLIYVIIYPALWLITLIAVGIWTYIKRVSLFQKDSTAATLILLFFCTPLPLLIASELMQPETTRSSSTYSSKNGVTIKDEFWTYTTGQVAARKYWKLNTEKWIDANEEDFKEDSTWVYFSKQGDTVKTELYNEGKLIRTMEFSK